MPAMPLARLAGRRSRPVPTMASSPIRTAAIVMLAVAAQLFGWVAFRWLGLQAHGEVPGAPIPEWYGLSSPVLGRMIALVPAVAVGWLVARHGALLGALVNVLASVLFWGFQFSRGGGWAWSVAFLLAAPPLSVLASALAEAIQGAIAGAAGTYFGQRAQLGAAASYGRRSG
jgi:hypothetical protein